MAGACRRWAAAMSALDTLCACLGAIGANKLRSGLTLLGIIVGVAAVVCMVSVGLGAQAAVAEKIRTLGANLLLVKPAAGTQGGARREAGSGHTLGEEDAAALLREVPEIAVAAPLVSRSAQLIAGNRNWATLVAGTDNGYLMAREWQIGEGRAFADSEIDGGAKVAIIGGDIARELFPGTASVGSSLRIGEVPFTVIGVLAAKGQGAAGRSQDDVVFIPLSTAQSRVLGAGHGTTRAALDFIAVKIIDVGGGERVREEIRELLRSRHHLRPDAADDFTIENPADVLIARQAAMKTLTYLLLSVASVALIVGGISIMNIMLVSVTERTREIGLRIAVGARRRDIRQQFLVEATLLALAGGLIGALSGLIGAAIIAWRFGWPVVISPTAIVLGCAFAGLIGIAFGLYPAQRAARLDPVAAIRFE
jgi:putative ABC transport system permease protein